MPSVQQMLWRVCVFGMSGQMPWPSLQSRAGNEGNWRSWWWKGTARRTQLGIFLEVWNDASVKCERTRAQVHWKPVNTDCGLYIDGFALTQAANWKWEEHFREGVGGDGEVLIRVSVAVRFLSTILSDRVTWNVTGGPWLYSGSIFPLTTYNHR